MGGVYGVKETVEFIIGILKIAKLIKTLIKDGVQLKDAADLAKAIMEPGPLKDAVNEALEGASQIPNEVREIDAEDTLNLVTKIGPAALDILKA